MLLCTLTVCSSLMTVLMNVAHKNFSDMDSKPLTGCTESYVFISKETRGKLIVYLYILSL
jgi:hypothetical protein